MAKSKQRKAEDKQPEPKAERPRVKRDPRPFIYAGLDVLFGILYIVAFSSYAVNRHPWAAAILWAVPVSVLTMGVSMVAGALLKDPKLRRIAWTAAVVAGAVMFLVAVILLALLLASAAFLSGVYGAFGKAAASGVLAGAALVAELIALLPVFQTKYLLTRAGRRAFGQAPLWRKAAAA